MKKILVVFLVNLFAMTAFAENIQLKITTAAGSTVTQDVDKNATFWGIDGEQVNYDFVSVQGLDQLSKLEVIELTNLKSVKTYSFLADAKNLKELYLTACTVNTLDFVKDLPKLKVLSLDVRFDLEKATVISLTNVDFSNLKKLEELRFWSKLYSNSKEVSKLPVVPRFYNIKSYPLLDLSNSDISEVSEDDVKLLAQYSDIILKSTPISGKEAELKKLSKYNIITE